MIRFYIFIIILGMASLIFLKRLDKFTWLYEKAKKKKSPEEKKIKFNKDIWKSAFN